MVDSVQRAGAVDIRTLKLITTENVVINLKEFFVELNIYEDIFSPCMKGDIVLSDSRNIIDLGNLVGEELINIEFVTPSFEHVIKKTFRVYQISDRAIVRDNNTQLFTLHFASVEFFYDINLPLFRPFEGEITDVVKEIFGQYIATGRNYDANPDDKGAKEETEIITPLVILNPTTNKVKFISPGWTPFKCLTWLASKSIPKEGKAKNYLFFESNKSFYFGSLEYIFKETLQNKETIGTYFKSAANFKEGMLDSTHLNREYFIAKDVTMVENIDHIKNYTNGYLANRLYFLDVMNKTYDVINYDYVEEYKNQWHTAGFGDYAVPIFSKNAFRNSASHISYYPKNPKLFDNFKDNINEKMGEIYGNRLSSLLDLTNIKLNLTIPGRTDVEVGKMLYFSYPSLGGKDDSNNADPSKSEDPSYSGYYFITAIRHKLNFNEHNMTMECVKDSLYTQS
jgi:hypothetical protein